MSHPLLAAFPRLSLLEGPTPIQRLTRLEAALGAQVEIHVKRDDLMGLGGGGNKLRKLEFLLADAQALGADRFITVGGLQSNHARLSAAACARLGLPVTLVLGRNVPRGDQAYQRNGNMLLDRILGAEVVIAPEGVEAITHATALAERLTAEGQNPYLVGSGGSSPVGCLGYADCAFEIAEQEQALGFGFDQILLPCGSTGTQAGLTAGWAALGRDPRAIRAYTVLHPLEKAVGLVAEKTTATLAMLDPAARFDPATIDMSFDARGPAYGMPMPAMVEALELVARTEGLLLDPVYSGKAFAGLLADLRGGRWQPGARLLFLMTGGAPGLFAYESEFA
ncbi:D-cysteine desulfhydrase family protein [Roseomonas sp. 18066]|uniref:D-cysteine desulfhydrase family protein n=1 Tax=Roseomonas sp. 18066 TaxID=2681412 RepID=UPI00135C7B16|nr:D-cysteine desulfhydrase family protein [Roseomonas sp. 18066]